MKKEVHEDLMETFLKDFESLKIMNGLDVPKRLQQVKIL